MCEFLPYSIFEGLQALYEEYKSQGFTVLAFPCNQFGGQEPLSNAEIKKFASETYRADFPIFSKVDPKVYVHCILLLLLVLISCASIVLATRTCVF